MTYRQAGQATCPKCDIGLRVIVEDKLPSIDIAHSGEDWHTAYSKIMDGIDMALQNNCKGLRVVHGYGSRRGHTHVIRDRAIEFLQGWASMRNYRLVPDKHTDGAHILYFRNSPG